MSKIVRLMIKGYIGIRELKITPGKINFIRGQRGQGKSSVLEGVEKTLRNKNRRTEVIRHGEEEAILFVELDDGLEIHRKVRKDKSDYLRLRKEDEGVPQTEKYVKSLSSGICFNPIDWIRLPPKDQTEILLSLIDIGWSKDDIINWFGHLVKDIDYTQHILNILKFIEKSYYETRVEVNREINEYKAIIEALYEGLPNDYDGETWRGKSVNDYYKKAYEAEENNKLIGEARKLEEGFRVIVDKEHQENQKEAFNVEVKYRNLSNELYKIIGEKEKSRVKSISIIEYSNEKMELELSKLQGGYERELQELVKKYELLKEGKKSEINEEVLAQKEKIREIEKAVLEITHEISKLEGKKENEILILKNKMEGKLEGEKIKVVEATRFLQTHKEKDITPLFQEAEYVNNMVNHLKNWDKIIEIRDGALPEKERRAMDLTSKISKARELPRELMKTAKVPVDGITIDDEGRVRINGKLIDGLSDGEKLDVAMRVARASAGDLKVICIDRFECLDKISQEILMKEIEQDDFQYFITEVSNTESNSLEIEKIGGIK